ncbi:MAG: hypothetical protein ACRDC4_00785 [Plesiomonas sp.]
MKVYVVVDLWIGTVELVTTDEKKAKAKEKELEALGLDPQIEEKEVVE